MKEFTLTDHKVRQGSLILVSPGNALAEEPDPEQLETLFPPENRKSAFQQEPFRSPEPSILLCRSAAENLRRLLERLSNSRQILAVSGFRSQAEQTRIWDQSWKENGAAYTQTFVAPPGHSEHQTGLAVDLAERRDQIDPICPAFPYTGICQDFRQLAPRFGYIERYPAGKETVTGIGPEPWHFRYVGWPHAQIMTAKGLVLEEYLAFLETYTSISRPFRFSEQGQEWDIFYRPWEGKGPRRLAVPDEVDCQISGTNRDGFIISLRRHIHGR